MKICREGSLTSAIVGGAIAVATGVMIYQTLGQQNRMGKAVQSKVDLSLFKADVTDLLRNPDHCLATFGGLDLGNINTNPYEVLFEPPTNPSGAAYAPAKAIYRDQVTGNGLPDRLEVFPFGNATSDPFIYGSSLKLGNAVFKRDPSATNIVTGSEQNLTLIFDQIHLKGLRRPDGTPMVKSFRLESFKLTIDSSNRLTSCSAAPSGSGSLSNIWELITPGDVTGGTYYEHESVVIGDNAAFGSPPANTSKFYVLRQSPGNTAIQRVATFYQRHNNNFNGVRSDIMLGAVATNQDTGIIQPRDAGRIGSVFTSANGGTSEVYLQNSQSMQTKVSLNDTNLDLNATNGKITLDTPEAEIRNNGPYSRVALTMDGGYSSLFMKSAKPPAETREWEIHADNEDSSLGNEFTFSIKERDKAPDPWLQRFVVEAKNGSMRFMNSSEYIFHTDSGNVNFSAKEGLMADTNFHFQNSVLFTRNVDFGVALPVETKMLGSLGITAAPDETSAIAVTGISGNTPLAQFQKLGGGSGAALELQTNTGSALLIKGGPIYGDNPSSYFHTMGYLRSEGISPSNYGIESTGCARIQGYNFGGAPGQHGCSSDKRLKKEINLITDTLEGILAIQPKSYKWKDSELDSTIMGFIAQDFEKIFPELTGTNKNKFKTLSQGALTPYLWQGVRELNQKLESENKNLKTKIEKLETSVDILTEALCEEKAYSFCP